MKNLLIPFLGLLFLSRLSGQCPTVPLCPPNGTVYTDTTNNQPWFWNTPPFTWDSLHQQGDLAEASVTAACTWLDTCGMGSVQADFILLLDLNSDSIQETRISSMDVLPAGVYVFNNLLGGTDTLLMDARTSLLRYHFDILTNRVGDSLQFSLVWVSMSDTILAQLPLGNHRLEWVIRQGAETDSCGYHFDIKDTAPPVMVCQPPYNVNIPPSGKITFWASDFLQSVTENVTSGYQLQLSVRKKKHQRNRIPFGFSGQPG